MFCKQSQMLCFFGFRKQLDPKWLLYFVLICVLTYNNPSSHKQLMSTSVVWFVFRRLSFALLLVYMKEGITSGIEKPILGAFIWLVKFG
jgi:hypothetical protein